MSLAMGKVTLAIFQSALNEHIFPSLGIEVNNGISERTARQWLVKLGWQNAMMTKGVNIDGHKRNNVKMYWKEKFLPDMAEYEQHMVKWLPDGPELRHVDLILHPGEQRIVPIFQDESSFHANEYKQTI